MVEPVTNEAQPTLGQMLRERREARGLSQEEAAQRSRVQPVFVRALEADDYRLLPDGLYLSRFVYEYAGFLGLDPAAAAEAFRRQLRRPGASSPLYKPVPLVAALPWRRILWIAAVILPLIPIGFVLLSLAGKERPEQAVPYPPAASEVSASPPATRTLDAEPLSPASPSVSPAAPASIPIQPPTPAPSGDRGPAARRHLLEVRAHGLTWLAVRVDEEPEYEVWLREGEMRRWVAERGFVLSVGNPRSLEIQVDGEPIRLSDGKSGLVRELRFPPPSPPQTKRVSGERAQVSKIKAPRKLGAQVIESKEGKQKTPSAEVP